MLLPDFKYHRPKTLEEAYGILLSCSNAALIAGGTDLLVEIKQVRRKHDDIISLNHIDELNSITEDKNSVYIGSAVSFNEILASTIIKKYCSVLIDAVSQIGTHQVRNTATIGGNLCTCASCADSAPVLIAYDAEVEVGSIHGSRKMPLTDFLLSHHQSNISQGEILKNIIIRKHESNFVAGFQKFGLREASSISVASVAVGMIIENAVVTKSSVVVGACAPTAIRIKTAESKLTGAATGDLTGSSAILSEIADSVSAEIKPIDDIRGSALFRKEIVRTLTKRAIINALGKYKID